MISTGWCILGFAALILGAELLINAGTRLAALLGVPPILIGLTVVSVGTSIPELAVGIDAARLGSASLAVGNIAGTNTFNILFILGLSALIAPLALEQRSIRIDLPMMVTAAVAMLVMAWDGLLTAFEGMLLVTAAIVYTAVIVRGAKNESPTIVDEFTSAFASGPGVRPRWEILQQSVHLLVGIAVVVIGADWLVKGSIELARQLHVSEAFIGLTVVAIGTSAPELVTTIISTIRDQRDIAVGNLVGSSIYNIFFILGTTLLVTPGGMKIEPSLIYIDIPVMTAVAIACVPVFVSGARISRLEGGVFVAAYFAYFMYLIVART
jgi:cation:H+ antiporter